MNPKHPLLLLSLVLLFHLSFQDQLIRDLSGTSPQNLLAQASEWALIDPANIHYPITTNECKDKTFILKPASLPIKSKFSKTYTDLPDHNMLRFFVRIYYMGDYTSQTVEIKFDQTTFETSKVLPINFLPGYFTCTSLDFSGEILYFGVLPHTSSSVTVEFSTNLHGSNIEVDWGIRDLSIVTITSDDPESPNILASSELSDVSITPYPCFIYTTFCPSGLEYSPCVEPCETCYGPDSDNCYTFLPSSPEALLCPVGQTLLSSGCVDCAVENCPLCNNDVSQCDTCLATCAQCTENIYTQCEECTVESNLVLYQGACIESCPIGTFKDSSRKCQDCQPGCFECSNIGECSNCDSSLISDNGYCVCDQEKIYYETESSGCTGICLLGCQTCIESQACLVCYPGLTAQQNGDCRCDIDGFYYQDSSGECSGQCYEYCNYCHDSTSCLECSGNRIPKNGKCECESPRVLIGTNCECPAYMAENPDTLTCEYNDIVDIAYQSTVSPLFDAILQFLINPQIKWTLAPWITWTGDCDKLGSSQQFQDYLSTQMTDVLLIPKIFLDFDIECDIKASYTNQNGQEISKQVHFQTLSSGSPQVRIVGGPFQIVNHNELNFIFAQLADSPISHNARITWTQTSGDDVLDMTKLYNSLSSNPLRLTIPKCTLSQGKLYTFKISVKIGTLVTSQEVIIGVYSAEIQLQPLQAPNYHIFSDDLILTASSQFSIPDECTSSILPSSDFFDLSSLMYTWQCFVIDLNLPTSNLPLTPDDDGLPAKITDDPNVAVHPDPLNLFYHSSSNPTLIIPSSYFTQGSYQFIFSLTVTVKNKNPNPSMTLLRPSLYALQTQAYIRVVSSEPFTPASFTCISDNNCQAYSDYTPPKFIATDPNPQYTYTWTPILFSAIRDLSAYNIFLTINGIYLESSKLVPQFLLTITDGKTNIASAFFTIPWNNRPLNGFLNVFPQEGEAYHTNFFLNTYGWTDFELPLTFEFFDTYDTSIVEREKVNLMVKIFEPFAFSPLLCPPNDYYCYFGVWIADNLGARSYIWTFVSLTNVPETFSEALEKSHRALTSSKTSTDLFARFRLISVILENINAWEVVSGTDYSQNLTSSQLKLTAVKEMEEIFISLNSAEMLKEIMLHNIKYSSMAMFNQDMNWKLYMNMLDSYYQVNSSTSLLPLGEYISFFSIVDNLIYSMKKPQNTIEDYEKVFIYLNTLLRSTLPGQIPTDPYISFQGTFYTYFTIKTTYCKILLETMDIPYVPMALRANFILRPNQNIPSEQCNREIDVIFMSFRPDYISTEEQPQKLIFLDLRDPITGKSLLDIFTFFLQSSLVFCPTDSECEPDGNGGTIIYGIFDLKNQVKKIFDKSKIDQLANFYVLVDFKFWKNVAFWTVLGFSLGFLASLYWLYVKHPTYCALKSCQNISQDSLFKKIRLFFLVVHPFMGIYLYNDPKITKTTKLAIYYQRLVIVMVFSTIFSSIEKGEGTIFKAYILLFNTLTVTPVNALLSRCFQYALNMKDKNHTIFTKTKLFIGIFLYLLLISACFFVIFIIEAQEGDSQNKTWALNFIIAFAQDLTLSPLISIIYKVLIFKASEMSSFLKKKTSSKILSLIISEDFKFIYTSIFIEAKIILTPTESCTSPRTTTLSPLSSDRKLLKFSTLDQRSPRTPYEFRSRRASESEINSVDLITVENLINNRFQTIFSEAKPESVKQFSETKENFPKMQSSNIYSKYSNPKLPSLGNSKTKEKRLINRTSIIFSPLESAVTVQQEEDVISFDASPQDTCASIPKLWKDSKTLKTSVSSQKSKSSKRCETVV